MALFTHSPNAPTARLRTSVFVYLATVVVLVAAGFIGGWYWRDHDGALPLITATNQATSTATTTGVIIGADRDIPDFLKEDVEFKLYWDLWKFIDDKYYDPSVLDTEKFYGSLIGMVEALDDPYSVFLTPTINKEFTEELKGRFEGIGAEIAVKNDVVTIVAPLPESPAEKAGLRPGDKVLAINGDSTEGFSAGEAANRIRGDAGTEVTLLVLREKEEWTEPKEFKITRAPITFSSVRWEMKDGGFAYIKVSHFNQETGEAFDRALGQALEQKPKGIILDLRNNPGGYLDIAIEMAGEWVNGQPVVIERFRNNEQEVYRSHRLGRLKDMPTMVLVNEGSASASEIVAGALQDYGLGTLIGKKTFGKGSVQELHEFSDGSSVKLTIANWLTPKERLIDGEGIAPDVEIDLSSEDYNADRDPQLDKALELIRQKTQ